MSAPKDLNRTHKDSETFLNERRQPLIRVICIILQKMRRLNWVIQHISCCRKKEKTASARSSLSILHKKMRVWQSVIQHLAHKQNIQYLLCVT
jgi:hypothetical protein